MSSGRGRGGGMGHAAQGIITDDNFFNEITLRWYHDARFAVWYKLCFTIMAIIIQASIQEI